MPDEHFQHHPYPLGGRPSIGDFGFMGPMFADLARDPIPSALMKQRAPNAHRWTERMNLANVADGEFPSRPETYPEDDTIPATLEPLLALIFQDWGPELRANAARFAGWVEENPSLPPGRAVSLDEERRVHPSLGHIPYALRGRSVERASARHALRHFARAATLARASSGEARRRFEALVQRAGGREVGDITLARPLVRQDHVLVLG